ncbi:MAG: methyltransferase domain-containing protein [Pseudolabrys sp.]|nr:methyltransferase domain-containing protein [Pseudolabrys sp.]
MPRQRLSPQPEVPGLAARRIAADILDGVLRRKIALDEQLSGKAAHPGLPSLADRDRALMRRLAATVLRRLGTLRHLVLGFLDKGFPTDAPRIETILLVGAAQILWLDVPDHAAVDLSVRLAQADRRASRYAGLVNAVLRRVAQSRSTLKIDVSRDTPDWLMARWRKTYGNEITRAIAAMNGEEPALDLTVKGEAERWADKVHGRALPTGTVRTLAHGSITLLPGFHEGAWWVQDAAAALPARLFGDIKGKRVADLCAAPGGKTAQLALGGAHVTAVDRSAQRLARLSENFTRLGLKAETVAADALEWQVGSDAEPFDAVLLDAPCSSTGTIRRHPDVPWLKGEADIAVLTSLQTRLLDKAVALTKPGGILIYCVCSLEPEEGEQQIEELLRRDPRMKRQPIKPEDVAGRAELISPSGDLRTLPVHLPDPEPRLGGVDGFFAARLLRS